MSADSGKSDCIYQKDKRFFVLLWIVIYVLIENAYHRVDTFCNENITNIAAECPSFNGHMLVMGDCVGQETPIPLPASLRPLFLEPVPINMVDKTTLQTLPGIGPALAKAIVETREQLGGVIRTSNDLLAVPGIGPGKLTSLSNKISFEAPVDRY